MKFLFSEEDGLYTPSQNAAGLSHNVHGGAAACLMASIALRTAPKDFVPVSQRTDFLSAIPLESCSVSVKTLREGRTSLVYDIYLLDLSKSKPSARSTLTLYRPTTVESLEQRKKSPWGGHTDPSSAETLPDRLSPIGQEWMLGTTDIRSVEKDVYWFRWRFPLMADGWDHWFTRILGPADWISGLVSPSHSDRTKTGPWPNTELTLNVDRELSGDWIGIKPKGDYRREGYGYAYAEVLDELGEIGQVTASVIAPKQSK